MADPANQAVEFLDVADGDSEAGPFDATAIADPRAASGTFRGGIIKFVTVEDGFLIRVETLSGKSEGEKTWYGVLVSDPNYNALFAAAMVAAANRFKVNGNWVRRHGVVAADDLRFDQFVSDLEFDPT